MCCLCFERVAVDELYVEAGETWDMCRSCGESEYATRVTLALMAVARTW